MTDYFPISDYNGLKYMLWLHLDYLELIILRLQFSQHSISPREDVKIIILWGFDQKNYIFVVWVLVQAK